MLVGSTVSMVKSAFTPPNLGGAAPKKPSPLTKKQEALVLIAVTFCLLGIGSYFVISDEGKSQTIGASMIAGVIGYWLH